MVRYKAYIYVFFVFCFLEDGDTWDKKEDKRTIVNKKKNASTEKRHCVFQFLFHLTAIEPSALFPIVTGASVQHETFSTGMQVDELQSSAALSGNALAIFNEV